MVMTWGLSMMCLINFAQQGGSEKKWMTPSYQIMQLLAPG